MAILVDFNIRFKNWCLDYITTSQSSKTDLLPATYGLHKLIFKLTYLLSTYSTCIDLVFTDQSNLVVDVDRGRPP